MYYVEYLVSYRGKRKVQSEYFKLGNTDCAAYCMNEPAVLIIQPIDKEYNDTAERQARVFSLRAKEHFLLVAFEVDKWNRDLTPWEAPSPFGDEDFGDRAGDTLTFITDKLIPVVLRKFKLPENIPVILGGYSLAGLFSLWSGYQTDRFTAVAAVSPSVWYNGWIEYVQDKRPMAKSIYLSLGDKEDKTDNSAVAVVRERIIEQYELLTKSLVKRTIEWNEGNHFKDPDLRCIKGFEWCIRAITDQHIS